MNNKNLILKDKNTTKLTVVICQILQTQCHRALTRTIPVILALITLLYSESYCVQTRKHPKPKRVSRRFDVSQFTNPDFARQFRIRIGGKFEPLLNLETDDIDELYDRFVDKTNQITKEIVGFQRNKKTAGLSPSVEQLCQQRRDLRKSLMANPTDSKIRDNYTQINQNVKSKVRQHKRNRRLTR